MCRGTIRGGAASPQRRAEAVLTPTCHTRSAAAVVSQRRRLRPHVTVWTSSESHMASASTASSIQVSCPRFTRMSLRIGLRCFEVQESCQGVGHARPRSVSEVLRARHVSKVCLQRGQRIWPGA